MTTNTQKQYKTGTFTINYSAEWQFSKIGHVCAENLGKGFGGCLPWN